MRTELIRPLDRGDLASRAYKAPAQTYITREEQVNALLQEAEYREAAGVAARKRARDEAYRMQLGQVFDGADALPQREDQRMQLFASQAESARVSATLAAERAALATARLERDTALADLDAAVKLNQSTTDRIKAILRAKTKNKIAYDPAQKVADMKKLLGM